MVLDSTGALLTRVIGALIVATFLPSPISTALKRLPVPENARWRFALAFLLALALLATYGAVVAGTSFLLAGYLTGVALADAAEGAFAEVWRDHVKLYIDWLVLLFFAATIGFVVPLKALFNAESIALGALLAMVATLGKLVCGVGAGNFVDGVAVGVAMLGRGEFSFLIAASARTSGVLNERLYAATIWGVLVPTLLTPVLFGLVFRWRSKRKRNESGSTNSGSDVVHEGNEESLEESP